MKLLIPLQEMVFPPDKALLPSLEQDASEPQKVCRDCMTDLLPMQVDLQKTMSKAMQPEVTQLDRSKNERYFNTPFTFALEEEIKKASYTLLNFTAENKIEGQDSLPRELLWDAEGIAIITFIKAGFFFTGRLGTGLVIGKLNDGSWSAPSAVCSTGVGWGFQIGGEVTDVVIVLNTRSALEAFTSNAQVSLGTELSVSVGPLGRSAATDVRAGDGGLTAAFSYAHSKGLFVGVSLEAAVLVSRDDINEAFYGCRVTPKELLLGHVPAPPAAQPLYNAISEVVAEPGLLKTASQHSFHEDPEVNQQIVDDRNLALVLQKQEFQRQAQAHQLEARTIEESPTQQGRKKEVPALINSFKQKIQLDGKGSSADSWAAQRDERLKASRDQDDAEVQWNGKELKEIKAQKGPIKYSLYPDDDDIDVAEDGL